jgi:hypothetical protein
MVRVKTSANIARPRITKRMRAMKALLSNRTILSPGLALVNHSHAWLMGADAQIPVVEQALETAALMLGTDKSRGYCLEMICADFLAGANLDSGNPDVLLHSIFRFFKFLPGEQKQTFLEQEIRRAS